MSTTTDWNTVTSDLQRAANNLAWFVLESMTVPGQPPPFLLSAVPTTVPIQDSPGQQEQQEPSPKRKRVDNSSRPPKGSKQSSIGKAVDRLVSETLV